MRVRIVTQSKVLSQALQLLVSSFGFEVCGSSHWGNDRGADVVVYDLTKQNAPYPTPSRLPSLALIAEGNEEDSRLLEQGYVGCLTPKADSKTLKTLLESIWHHQTNLSRKMSGNT